MSPSINEGRVAHALLRAVSSDCLYYKILISSPRCDDFLVGQAVPPVLAGCSRRSVGQDFILLAGFPTGLLRPSSAPQRNPTFRKINSH